MKVVYSNCLGSYVFESGKIVDSMNFRDVRTVVERSLLLERGELIEEERMLLQKHKNVLFANKKSGDVKQLDDKSELTKILSAFRGDAPKYFEPLLLVAKRKISESVKFDLLIIQSISSIEDLEKTENLIAKRLREWYELYNPEFSKSMPDHRTFARTIVEKSRDELLKELRIEKEFSMGADIKKTDLDAIYQLSEELSNVFVLEEKQKAYVEKLMNENCRNISTVAGPILGAKLIALAGSLERLATLPASTVQLLGAEKALFRHIKTGAKSPKHGVILQHPLVSGARNKGRAARALADKISLAAKVDYFKGEFVGDKIFEALKKKLKGE